MILPYEVRPMLCHINAVDTTAGFDPDEWVAEAKLDGYRTIACRTREGDIRIFNGRNGAEYTGQLPYLETALVSTLTLDTVVDGELISPRGFNAVGSAMRTNDPHIPSAAKPALELWIFDVLRVSGNDVRNQPWLNRRKLVDLIGLGVNFSDIPYLRVSPLLDLSDETLHTLLDMDMEGLVLKRKTSKYVNDRSPNVVKVKPQKTADAVITGFKPGEPGGSFDGMVGAFRIDMLDAEGNRTGATTTIKCGPNKVHEEVTAHPERFLDRHIEFKHHGMSKLGVPRHPVKPRFRDDLPAVGEAAPGKITPKTAPSEKSGPPKATGKAKMRNYAQMSSSKLEGCIQDLEKKEGDAYDRCVSKGGDPEQDLAVARQVATERGLITA